MKKGIAAASLAAALTLLTVGCSNSNETSPSSTAARSETPTTSSAAAPTIDSAALATACSSIEKSAELVYPPLLNLANGGGGTLSRLESLALARAADELAPLRTGGAFEVELAKFASAVNEALQADFIPAETAAAAFLAFDKMRVICGQPPPTLPS